LLFYIGIFDIPNIKDKDLAANAIPLTIICDNIREPGNLGSIIRAAAAVGCERLLLMKGKSHYMIIIIILYHNYKLIL